MTSSHSLTRRRTDTVATRYHTTILLLWSTRFIRGKNKGKMPLRMGLQMVGHIYHTTSVLIVLSCILRFIHGKNKGKTPLRMRVDGFADGETHISTHNRAKTDHLYIRTKNKDKCHCACMWTSLQMVGHVSPTTLVLCLACLCLFSEKAIVCLSDIPRTHFITYSTFCIY